MLHVIVEGMRKPTEKPRIKWFRSRLAYPRRYVASRWGSTGVGRFGTSGLGFEHPAGGTGVSPLSAGATCVLEAAISEMALSGAIPPAAWCGATVYGS